MTDSQPRVSDIVAEKAKYLLANNLRNYVFYFSLCPDSKTVELSPIPGLRCNRCGIYHSWLTIDRDEVRELMEKQLPERVGDYIKYELEAHSTLTT